MALHLRVVEGGTCDATMGPLHGHEVKPEPEGLILEPSTDGCGCSASGSESESESDWGNELDTAAVNGDLERVKELLGRGADPNPLDESGATPLMQAALFGHFEIARLLLAQGADPNVAGGDGSTALMHAVRECYLEIVTQLLESGRTDPNPLDEDCETPLMSAAWFGCVEIAHLLLAQGADPNVAAGDGYTALTNALFKGHLEIVVALLKHGVDPNQAAPNNGVCTTGETPLMNAAGDNNCAAVRLLLSFNANPNLQAGEERDGTFVLAMAACTTRPPCVKCPTLYSL